MFAVQIRIDDDWVYVTEDPLVDYNEIRIKKFNTWEIANEHAEIWRLKGREQFVSVVKYRK